jgi:RNA polymerase sigma factor (TIGR02999 family)
MSDVTRILSAIEGGDHRAADELLPLLYEQLRLLAARKLSQEPPGQTLQATALVHEAYIRLVGSENQNWDSRGHFFTAAAEAMHRILVENARRKKRLKRGGDHQKVDLDDATLAIEMPSDDLVGLDEALVKLTKMNGPMADVVKLRYFAGLSLEQISQIIGVSRRTVSSYWAYARAWLYREMAGANVDSP